MNKLSHFAKNPFLTIEIGKYRFGKFVSNHIARTKSLNNPAFAPLILSTQAQYDAIFGNLENYDRDSNSRQSYTKQVNQKMKEFSGKVLEMESLVCVKFKKKSPTYEEFYPHGRTEYYRTNKKNILMIFERIIKLTTTYESDLGSEWKTEFVQMYDEFLPIFEQQGQKKGSVKMSASDFKTLKLAMCKQLYKNLLTMLAEYHEMPKKALNCFDETIVNWKKHKKKKAKGKKPNKEI
jgi:hypothetical protein